MYRIWLRSVLSSGCLSRVCYLTPKIRVEYPSLYVYCLCNLIEEYTSKFPYIYEATPFWVYLKFQGSSAQPSPPPPSDPPLIKYRPLGSKKVFQKIMRYCAVSWKFSAVICGIFGFFLSGILQYWNFEFRYFQVFWHFRPVVTLNRMQL